MTSLLAAILTVGSVAAQTDSWKVGRNDGYAVNPALAENSGQILRFDSTVCRIGTLTEDDNPREVVFAFTNVSGRPVLITRVRTTCGCTSAGADTERVLPGCKGKVILKYVPRNHPGTIDTNAFVYIEGMEEKPVARLTLLGNVLPGKDVWSRFRYAIGNLRLKRKTVEFSDIRPGMRPEERIWCGNSGDLPLKLNAVIVPEFASFRTEPEVIEPGEEADIVITLDVSRIPESRGTKFSFPVVVEGVAGRPSDRTLTVKVER